MMCSVGIHITPCVARNITHNNVVHITYAQHAYHECIAFHITTAEPSITKSR